MEVKCPIKNIANLSFGGTNLSRSKIQTKSGDKIKTTTHIYEKDKGYQKHKL